MLRDRCRLEQITFEQRKTLVDWLLNSLMTYDEVVGKLFDEFKIITNRDRVSHFYRKNVYPELMRRRQRAVDEVSERDKVARDNPAVFRDSTIDLLWEKIWAEGRKQDTTAKDLKIYVELIVKLKGQILDEAKTELMERRVLLLEKRARALEQDVKNRKPRLSDEAFLEKMRTVLKGERSNTTNGTQIQGTTTETRYLTNGISP